MSLQKPPFESQSHVFVQAETANPSPANSLEFADENLGKWVPVVSCKVTYSAYEFSQVIDALVHFPERNSPLILRADVESDVEISHSVESTVPELKGFQPTRHLRRILYRGDATVLVLSPDLSEEHPTPPFYHPAVAHLAIRFTGTHLTIEVVPLAGSDSSTPRLVKTCVSLLEGVYRVGYGFANGYRKRVDHDTMVDKAEFQDLYIKMKEMHGGLVETWQEATDPSKHVFEDIGIATFLMLLWKSTYQGSDSPTKQPNQKYPWSHFARPPGGFRDIGCGNGLLTHILVLSGYEGLGIDLRARKSWTSFGPETSSRLKVEALDFTSIKYDASLGRFTGLPDVLGSNDQEQTGRVFLIGNHADELTPWMPVIAHAAGADFLSIPCCFWALDSRFHAQKRRDMPGPDCSAQPSPSEPWELALADRLHSVLGGTADANSGTKKGTKQPSQYGRYMLWLARLQRGCGFVVDVEALRIPSTRNWAFAGTSRTWKTESERARVDQYVEGLVSQVRERGMFKTRVPEGKEGGFITLASDRGEWHGNNLEDETMLTHNDIIADDFEAYPERGAMKDLQNEDMGGMTLTPSDHSLFEWTGILPGPEGSVYEGGEFHVEITLPSDYPFHSPRLRLKTKIYHMNINDQGGICLDILKNAWSPALSLYKVMLSLSSLLTDPNPNDPLVPSIANEYTRRRKVHDTTARRWVQLHAQPVKVQAPPPPPPPAPAKRSRGRPRTNNNREAIMVPDDEPAPAPTTAAKRKRGGDDDREDRSKRQSTGGAGSSGSRPSLGLGSGSGSGSDEVIVIDD
ncbi:hypothetical protein RHS04_01028 [Rhizoctonia solani]|uniref:tRNA (uracil-O(2)-)-methyltransferase n=1 Tax=Rhizoctonia solani TaxID=456999 RepID=A0A8H7HDZ4_9AGAM|nr:hypothetical protein RHS04_01028 [Rhizoctonia solani]